MKFSSFLKETRKKLSLSQQEIVNIISVNNKHFYNLNTTTYNRWENGHTTPSTFKIAILLELLDVNLFDAYRTLDLKLSKNNLNSFQAFMTKKKIDHNKIRLLSPTLPKHENFETFNHNYICTDQNLIQRIKGNVNNFLRQSSEEITSKDIFLFKTLQNNQDLVITTCFDTESGTYSAQGTLLFIAPSSENKVLEMFKQRTLKIKELEYTKDKRNSLVLVLPPSHHSNIWWKYFLTECLKDISNKAPRKIYVILLTSDALKEHMSIGFKVEAMISNKMVINSNLSLADESDNKIYLLSIDYYDFISHPGVIDFIKNSSLSG